MDTTRSKIKSSSMVAFIIILIISIMLILTTISHIIDWLTTGGASSNPDFVHRGASLLRDTLLIALAIYVAFVFLRINRKETPFFIKLPKMIKAAAVFLFLSLTVPKWLSGAIISVQTGKLTGAFVDDSVMFAFMLASMVFCLGCIFEYGYLVQNENSEII